MIGVEEIGRLMMLAMLLRLVEMSGDISIEKLIVQARDGGTLRFQHNLQGAALMSGGIMGVVIIILAWPTAWCLDDGPSFLSFALLSLVPMIRSFQHLDFRRFERHMNFSATLVVEAVSAVVILVLTPVLTLAFDNHNVFIPLVISQSISATVLSHLIAKRRYRIAFDVDAMWRIWRFGGPLLVNGFLMFAIFQADRMIVAFGYEWHDVGRYAIAAQLALLPTQIFGRAAQSILLPVFRKDIRDGTIHLRMRQASRLFAGFSFCYLIGFGLIANPFLTIVYGSEFGISALLSYGLAGLGAFRVLRTPYSICSVALGRTHLPVAANLWRVSALAPATVAAIAGAPIFVIAVCGAVGEAAAALFARCQIRHAMGMYTKVTAQNGEIVTPQLSKVTMS